MYHYFSYEVFIINAFKSFNRLSTSLFILLLVGYFYTYYSIVELFFVRVAVGLVASLVYPCILWLLFYYGIRWMGKDYSSDALLPYTSLKSYARVYALGFESALFIVTLLVLTTMGLPVWVEGVMWLLSSVVCFWLYPKYISSTLSSLDLTDQLLVQVRKKLQVTVSLTGVFCAFMGFAILILSLIAQLVV